MNLLSEEEIKALPTNAIVDYNSYKIKIIGNEYILETYTALWCKPCCEIKPKVNDYIDSEESELISTGKIDKLEFKEHVNKFIPFFRFRNTKTETWSCIQTSDFSKFLQMIQETIVV